MGFRDRLPALPSFRGKLLYILGVGVFLPIATLTVLVALATYEAAIGDLFPGEDKTKIVAKLPISMVCHEVATATAFSVSLLFVILCALPDRIPYINNDKMKIAMLPCGLLWTVLLTASSAAVAAEPYVKLHLRNLNDPKMIDPTTAWGETELLITVVSGFVAAFFFAIHSVILRFELKAILDKAPEASKPTAESTNPEKPASGGGIMSYFKRNPSKTSGPK